MKSQTVGLQVQMQKVHQHLPIHGDQNGETRIQHPMIL
jgi:hypothetical protein